MAEVTANNTGFIVETDQGTIDELFDKLEELDFFEHASLSDDSRPVPWDIDALDFMEIFAEDWPEDSVYSDDKDNTDTTDSGEEQQEHDGDTTSESREHASESRKHARDSDKVSTSEASSDQNQDTERTTKKLRNSVIGRPRIRPDITGFQDHYLEAFNSNDMDKIRELTIRHAVPDCSFQGCGMTEEVVGRLHFVEFSKYITKKSPDVVMLIKNVKLESRVSLRWRFYVSWTAPSMPAFGSGDSIYCPRRKSILEKMDLSKKSEAEIKVLAERERYLQETQQKIHVYARGEMCLYLNRHNKITKIFVSDFNFLSFDALSDIGASSAK